MPERALLEIAVDNADDAALAADEGADRLELCRDLAAHGLTPAPALVREVRARVRVPVMAMVRPEPGGFVANGRVGERLAADADAVLSAGADGIAFGALTPDGRVCPEVVGLLVSRAGRRQAVFHRAFDLVPDPEEAVGALVRAGVDRILTAGQTPAQARLALGLADHDALHGEGPTITGRGDNERLERLAGLVALAAGRIEVLAGAGVRANNVGALLVATGVVQVHASCRAAGAARIDAVEVRALRAAIMATAPRGPT